MDDICIGLKICRGKPSLMKANILLLVAGLSAESKGVGLNNVMLVSSMYPN